MNALWNAIAQQVATHLADVEAVAAAVLISCVCSIPEKFPTSWQEWWTWGRDTCQGTVPLKFQKSNHAMPVEPGKEQ